MDGNKQVESHRTNLTPTGISAPDWRFDTTTIKRLDRPDNLEIKLRVLFLGGSVLLVHLVYDMPELLVWYVVRMAFLAGYFWFLSRLPDKITLPQTIGLGVIVFIDQLLYVSVAVYLWTQELPIFWVYSLCIVATAMITVVWVRAEEPFLWVLDTIGIALCLLTLPFMHYALGKPLLHCILMFATFVLVLIYFVLSLWSVWKNRTEFRRAQQIETQRTKVEAMGRLTGGVAHDFNNLLTVILGNIELSRLTASPEERDELLSEAEAAGQRAARMTAQLLSFSRQSVLSPELVKMGDVIESARGFLARLLPASISIKVPDNLDGLPPVHLDATKLEAVIVNLAINARDAMPDGGRITIATEYLNFTKAQRIGSTTLAEGRYIALDVRDTGTGIPADVLERVTDPYFTTKPVGKGSGLGLSMAKGFAEQSGGALHISSMQGAGTTVRVYVPVAGDGRLAKGKHKRPAAE